MANLKLDKTLALLDDSARKDSEGDEAPAFNMPANVRVSSSKALFYNLKGITNATSPLEMTGKKHKENTSNLATFKIVKDKAPGNCKFFAFSLINPFFIFSKLEDKTKVKIRYQVRLLEFKVRLVSAPSKKEYKIKQR